MRSAARSSRFAFLRSLLVTVPGCLALTACSEGLMLLLLALAGASGSLRLSSVFCRLSACAPGRVSTAPKTPPVLQSTEFLETCTVQCAARPLPCSQNQGVACMCASMECCINAMNNLLLWYVFNPIMCCCPDDPSVHRDRTTCLQGTTRQHSRLHSSQQLPVYLELMALGVTAKQLHSAAAIDLCREAGVLQLLPGQVAWSLLLLPPACAPHLHPSQQPSQPQPVKAEAEAATS